MEMKPTIINGVTVYRSKADAEKVCSQKNKKEFAQIDRGLGGLVWSVLPFHEQDHLAPVGFYLSGLDEQTYFNLAE